MNSIERGLMYVSSKYGEKGDIASIERIIDTSRTLKELGYGADYQLVAIINGVFDKTDATKEEVMKFASENVLEAEAILNQKAPVEEQIFIVNENNMARANKIVDVIYDLKYSEDEDYRKQLLDNAKRFYIPLAKGTKASFMIQSLVNNLDETKKKL